VYAVGCHARALVLLAQEVRESGVRRATENLTQLMTALERKYPGERERSLLASVQLSLNRLPAATREKIRPMGVFQGGGWLRCIGVALGLDIQKDEEIALAKELIGVGLAEQLPFEYVRFDPALAPALQGEMSAEERDSAGAAWAKAMAAEIDLLGRQQFKDANLAASLCLLDLPNLLAALEYLAKTEEHERVVALATKLEALVTSLNRPKALALAISVRDAAAQRLGGWNHAQFEAARAAVERQLDQGDFGGAVRSATSLLEKAEQASDSPYPETAYDCALAQTILGRCLRETGAAAEALPLLEEARFRFETLGETRMAHAALTDSADSLTDLGRYDEATTAYEAAIQNYKELGDTRSVAVGKGQLATVRLRQRRYEDALKLYSEVLIVFKELGEERIVAISLHQIGRVRQEAGQADAAEDAYQESLKIKVQIGDAPGEAMTLLQLGNLYSNLGRGEDAVRCYRQSADVRVRLGDLKGEGLVRNNLAIQLMALKGYAEARIELKRAIECDKPFGHVPQPWGTFQNLSILERAAGNEVAAQKARAQAVQAYLAYRRDGGEPGTEWGQDLASDPVEKLTSLQRAHDLQPNVRAVIRPLEAILAGSRDTNLADDPNLDYDDAAELLLLMERLQSADGARA
jgi:tetratricopeptide (TPR) repeat protein